MNLLQRFYFTVSCDHELGILFISKIYKNWHNEVEKKIFHPKSQSSVHDLPVTKHVFIEIDQAQSLFERKQRYF